MRPSVITLGTFDGVHRGHCAILRSVIQRAKTLNSQSVVLAFGMPPRHAGAPRREPVLLTTLDEKLDILRQRGVNRPEVLVFDRKTASTPPGRFFVDTIVKEFRAREMIVGPRVAFGKDRAGRLPLLRRMGREHGVRIRLIRPVQGADGDISSRRIRRLLKQGNLKTANALLGYPYSAAGRVVHGDGRGRHLGFPTANLAIPADKILPPGVFWVKVIAAKNPVPLRLKRLKKALDGLCNIGTRPTFTPMSREIHCEIFLMGRSDRLYGKALRIVFLRKIRVEKRFSSARDLIAQIGRDGARVRRWSKAFFFTK